MWSAANKREKIQDEKLKKQFNYIIVMFEVILIIIGLLSIPIVANIYKNDYKYNYSSSKELADYINENVEQNSIMLAEKDAQASTIIPYIENGSKFWNIRTKQYYTYVTWNWDRERDIEGEEVEKEIEEDFDEDDNLYYIYCTKRPDDIKEYLEKEGKLEEVYATEPSLMDETYILYKINKQKLDMNSDKFEQYKTMLEQNLQNLKANELKQELVDELKKIYPIKIYYKGN